MQDKSAGQSPSQASPSQNAPAQPDAKKGANAKPDASAKPKDDRMFYVMPNHLTVDGQDVAPISWKEKFKISAEGSFDPYEFTLVGVVSALRQATDSSPGFGQGWGAYGERYGAAFADQVDGNIMVGGVFPSIMKIDPRYFRRGTGSFASRFAYAIDRLAVARTDSGRSVFNVPEFAGNAAAIYISNFYYPDADRSFSSSLTSWATQVGLDAFGNELKEFWPDVHRYLQKRKEQSDEKKLQKQQRQQQKASQ